jgi:S4 domain protein YaaA
MEKIHIHTSYITLGQFLKLIGLISSGGEVKYFLKNNRVLINEEPDDRRGKKLYNNDVIKVLNHSYQIVHDED